MILGLFLVPLPGQALASSFNPTCTIPPDGTNYVSGPNIRGTTSILWNCISIILLCTWNIQSLNIPASRLHTNSTLYKIWWAILDSRTKIKWMILTVLAPEFLMGMAFHEWRTAKANCNERMSQYADKDGVEWEMIHTYFSNMGGFVLDFSSLLQDGRAMPVDDEAMPTKLNHYKKIAASRMKHKMWALNAEQLHDARRDGLIETLPRVSVRELERLRKDDSLVKVFTILQVTWLIVGLIVRGWKHLPSSQLEIGALAFSASSLLTYILLWGRPQGVQSVRIILPARLATIEEIRSLMYSGPRYLWTGPRTSSSKHSDMDLVTIPNDAVTFEKHVRMLASMAPYKDVQYSLILEIVPGGILFGTLHLLAWKFHFPTPLESSLWRICAVAMTTLPIVSIPFNVVWLRSLWSSKLQRRLAALSYIGLILIPYTLARLFILLELFRSLLYLPPEAFTETWSVAFPHWG